MHSTNTHWPFSWIHLTIKMSNSKAFSTRLPPSGYFLCPLETPDSCDVVKMTSCLAVYEILRPTLLIPTIMFTIFKVPFFLSILTLALNDSKSFSRFPHV